MLDAMEKIMVSHNPIHRTENEQNWLDTGGWKKNSIIPYFDYVSKMFEKIYHYHTVWCKKRDRENLCVGGYKVLSHDHLLRSVYLAFEHVSNRLLDDTSKSILVRTDPSKRNKYLLEFIRLSIVTVDSTQNFDDILPLDAEIETEGIKSPSINGAFRLERNETDDDISLDSICSQEVDVHNKKTTRKSTKLEFFVWETNDPKSRNQFHQTMIAGNNKVQIGINAASNETVSLSVFYLIGIKLCLNHQFANEQRYNDSENEACITN